MADTCARCPETDVCPYCGCCQHSTEPCKVNDAPTGMRCPDYRCGCEGRS